MHKHVLKTIQTFDGLLGTSKIVTCERCNKSFFALCDAKGNITHLREIRNNERNR